MAKHLAHDYSVLMIVWLRLAVGSTIVAAHVVPKFGARVLLPHAPLLQIGRGLSSLLAMALLYRGFRSLPLAECTAIVFIAPVLANILSALFLKETGNRFSWLAAALSFVGVLIIARPGSSLYTWQALFPIGGAIALASQIALTRARHLRRPTRHRVFRAVSWLRSAGLCIARVLAHAGRRDRYCHVRRHRLYCRRRPNSARTRLSLWHNA